MSSQQTPAGSRTFLAGKLISNFGQSTIDCVVRRLSDEGATVEVENSLGIPQHCHLLIVEEGTPRPCKLVWQSDNQLGVAFEDEGPHAKTDAPDLLQPEQQKSFMREPMLALRAAFDEIQIGIVLLDSSLRAQFINRAFRKMWRVPDAMASRNPSFVSLMYHGRDTNAYQVPAAELDAYVVERVRLVKSGDGTSKLAPIEWRSAPDAVCRASKRGQDAQLYYNYRNCTPF